MLSLNTFLFYIIIPCAKIPQEVIQNILYGKGAYVNSKTLEATFCSKECLVKKVFLLKQIPLKTRTKVTDGQIVVKVQFGSVQMSFNVQVLTHNNSLQTCFLR